MLRPNIFSDNFDSYVTSLIDDMFSSPSNTLKKMTSTNMRTDIKDVDGNYEMEIDLPGYAKEDLKAELKDGYLVVTAKVETENDEQDENGSYIKRERYTGSCKRSYFVGEDLKQEDIKASFKDGVLKLVFPKDKQKPEVDCGITIE